MSPSPLGRKRLFGLVALVATLGVASVAPPARADDPVSDEAKSHFKAGVSLLQDPDGERVEEAYREFKAAYTISKSSKILGNMGFCAMKLERDGEAIEAYTQYLRDVTDLEADERAQITRDVQTLGVGVVRVGLKVTAPAGTKVIVSDVRTPVKGDRITNTYPVQVAAGASNATLNIGVRSGHHVITIRSPGFADETWEVDALAGSRETHEVTLRAPVKDPTPAPVRSLPEAPRAEQSPSVVPWVVAGVGGAMVVVGAITGVVALGKQSDISTACPNDVCPASFDLAGARSSAKTFIGVTDVLLIGGGVLAAAGITWGILSSSKSSGAPASAPKTRISLFPALSASCGPQGCTGVAKVNF